LAVMRRRMPPYEVTDEQLRNLIALVIGGSERTAPRWLSLYAQTLVDPASTAEAWQAATAVELAAIEKRPDKERIAVTRDFLRGRIEMLQMLGRDAEMLQVLQQLLPLQGGSVDEVLEIADWLIDRRAWPLVEQLVANYPALFDEDPHLGYRQAALHVQQGQTAAADERIQKILALTDPDDGSLHIELGFDLQNRGQYDWAEREYRHAIASTEPGSYAAIEASYRLGYMFHDLSRHADAYAALKVIADLVQKDPEMMKRVQQLNHTRNRIFSQMHFSHALMLGEAKSYEAQQNELMNALKFDQENADILIAMYRVPDPSVTWRDETRERIERLREVYEQRVVGAEREMEALPGQLTSQNLAQQLNQLAWLIANTYGDFEAAIRYSRRSLELAPEEAGYLDTLGRCYYAARDYTNAVRYQRRAVELEPHSGQIRRQLEVFEQALAQSR